MTTPLAAFVAATEQQIATLRQRLADAEARVRAFESFWWAFWDALIEQEFSYEGMDCEALVTETAVTLGFVKQEPYDPEKHLGIVGDPEPGDPIYTLALARRTT